MSPLGRPRVHLARTGSTNDVARSLALAGAPHGTLVTAGEQTAGRGRHGRAWTAPAGSSLLMSLLLRDPPSLLPLIAAVALCDAAGPQARIKWPNDIVVARAGDGGHGLAKLAGILVEARLQAGWAVLGVGVNVAVRIEDLPPELRPSGQGPDARSALPAATLGRRPAEVEALLALLLAALERRLAQPAQVTLEAWRARDALLGRRITWGSDHGERPAAHGTAHGVDGTGRLVVELDWGGRLTLGAGEVHLLDVGEPD